MKLFSRGSAAKHDFEVTLHSVSSWPAEASSDLLVVSWRRGARRAGSIVAAGNRRRIDGGDDSSTATTTLDLSGATIAVPATMYKVRRGLIRSLVCSLRAAIEPSPRTEPRGGGAGWRRRLDEHLISR